MSQRLQLPHCTQSRKECWKEVPGKDQASPEGAEVPHTWQSGSDSANRPPHRKEESSSGEESEADSDCLIVASWLPEATKLTPHTGAYSSFVRQRLGAVKYIFGHHINFAISEHDFTEYLQASEAESTWIHAEWRFIRPVELVAVFYLLALKPPITDHEEPEAHLQGGPA